MANSIVFQSSAEQLKTAIYGYDGANYLPLKVSDDGSMDVTVGTIASIGTINNVTNLGTLNTVSNVVNLGTLSTVSSVVNLGTLDSIVGTVNVNLADRTFTSTTYTIEVGAATTTYTDLLNISKYQDTSWYLRNMTATANRETVTIRLAVTPSTNLTSYPRVLISETATISANPKVITNDYYMKYITAQVANASANTQTVVIIFNGRY